MVGLAAYAVMRVSSRLAHTRLRTVYDLAEAVQFVADGLPDELSAKLSYDDVEAVLLWRLDHLRLRGSATYGRGDMVAAEAEGRSDESVEDEGNARSDESGATNGATNEVVISEDDSVDYVLAKAEKSSRDINALDVVVVLDLEGQYLRSIGALGPPAEEAD